MLYTLPDKLGERELTRQTDLARLVRLAAELDDGELTCAGFAAELRRAVRPGQPRGARRAPAHLPPGEGARVRRGLPAAARREGAAHAPRAGRDEERDEERRLLYVGITRARRLARDHVVARPEPVPRRARRRDPDRPRPPAEGRAAPSRPPIPSCTARSRPGGRSGRRQRRCRRTSSSTTRRWRRSPARSRARSTSSPRCPVSGRRSSTATATRCSPSSVSRRGRPPRAAGEQVRRVAADALAAARLALLEHERPRVGERPEPALRGSAPRRLRRDARRRSCRPARRAPPPRGSSSRPAETTRSDERDQALRVDGPVGDDHRRERERANVVALLLGARDHDGVHASRAGRGAAGSAGRAGSSAGGRARRPAAGGARRACAPGRRRARPATAGSGSKSAR